MLPVSDYCLSFKLIANITPYLTIQNVKMHSQSVWDLSSKYIAFCVSLCSMWSHWLVTLHPQCLRLQPLASLHWVIHISFIPSLITSLLMLLTKICEEWYTTKSPRIQIYSVSRQALSRYQIIVLLLPLYFSHTAWLLSPDWFERSLMRPPVSY